MAVDFESAVSRGWRFARSLERIGVLMMFYIVAALLVIVPILFIYKTMTVGAFNVASMLQSFVGLLLAIIFAGLIVLYGTLAFIHNYANQKSLNKSFDYASKKYLRFLGAASIVGLVGAIAGAVPVLGVVFSIVVSMIFFFVQQEVAVRGSTISKSLTNSYDMFKKSWLQILIALIITVCIGLVLLIVFAIPLLLVVFATIFLPATAGAPIAPAITANLGLYALAGLIFIFGLALTVLFTTGIKTDVYMQLRKGRRK